jgi:hypothetical protein
MSEQKSPYPREAIVRAERGTKRVVVKIKGRGELPAG